MPTRTSLALPRLIRCSSGAELWSAAISGELGRLKFLVGHRLVPSKMLPNHPILIRRECIRSFCTPKQRRTSGLLVIQNGATFVKVDKFINLKDNSPMLLFPSTSFRDLSKYITRC